MEDTIVTELVDEVSIETVTLVITSYHAILWVHLHKLPVPKTLTEL